MRPIALKGHERPITKVQCNTEGDLLFSAAKDNKASVWYTENGERLGTYDGHKGVIWCMDVSWDSKTVLTGAADNQCFIWDCETGKIRNKLQSSTAVRSCGLSYSGKILFYSTDDRMKFNCTLNIFDMRDSSQIETQTPQMSIPMPDSKITAALWSHLDYMIITGHESGAICQYDIRHKTNEPVNWVHEHRKGIQDLQISKEQIMVISASKDCTAKLFDTKTLNVKKTYKSERPVNSAAIAPDRDTIVLGGGEEAMQVTQTDTRQGKFEAKFYHMIFEDEYARIKGHYGPINSLTFHPDGKGYSSGAEDSFVRIHQFDQDFLDFDFDC
jgi:translation initiation factor 3 subunit I